MRLCILLWWDFSVLCFFLISFYEFGKVEMTFHVLFLLFLFVMNCEAVL